MQLNKKQIKFLTKLIKDKTLIDYIKKRRDGETGLSSVPDFFIKSVLKDGTYSKSAREVFNIYCEYYREYIKT